MQKLNEKTYNEILKEKALIYFSAKWCRPCQEFSLVISEAEKRLKIVIYNIDVEENRDIAVKHLVRGVPTLIIFNNQKEAKRLVGATDLKGLLEWIQN